jgi:hypothetical protein
MPKAESRNPGRHGSRQHHSSDNLHGETSLRRTSGGRTCVSIVIPITVCGYARQSVDSRRSEMDQTIEITETKLAKTVKDSRGKLRITPEDAQQDRVYLHSEVRFLSLLHLHRNRGHDAPRCANRREFGRLTVDKVFPISGDRQLGSYRGVSFQLANSPRTASWKLAPRVDSHLPLASVSSQRGHRRHRRQLAESLVRIAKEGKRRGQLTPALQKENVGRVSRPVHVGAKPRFMPSL